jgi:hypothetical protein
MAAGVFYIASEKKAIYQGFGLEDESIFRDMRMNQKRTLSKNNFLFYIIYLVLVTKGFDKYIT